MPGCREVVADGDNGFLVPARDAAAVAEALARLIDDADLRRRMGTAARRRAAAEFSESLFVEQSVAAWRAVLGPAMPSDAAA